MGRYYPYHFAPFASDFVGLGDLVVDFPEGTTPFMPFEQLMVSVVRWTQFALDGRRLCYMDTVCTRSRFEGQMAPPPLCPSSSS